MCLYTRVWYCSFFRLGENGSKKRRKTDSLNQPSPTHMEFEILVT